MAKFKLIMPKYMKILKVLVPLAFALLAAGAHAQSLRINPAGAGVYCRFSPDCKVTPTEHTDSCPVTNAAATCVLESRTFPGNTMDSTGKYGYEYMLTINNNGGGSSTDTNLVSVSSLTLNFADPQPFAFGEHASNFVWALTSDGPVGLVPSSADANDKKVTISFDPPLTLNLATGQTTNTCYFGLISAGAPQVTSATIAGSTQDPANGTVPFKAKLEAQTP